MKSTLYKFWIWVIRYMIVRPIVRLSFMINGTMDFGNTKWYYRIRDVCKPPRWKWLNTISYKLTKYIMFK